MARRTGQYRRGDFWRIDDRTGFAVRASRTAKEWTGAIVAKEDYEARHPLDFVRARPDKQAVNDPRSDPEPIYAGPDGGPFFLLTEGDNGELGMVIEIDDDEMIFVYAGS